MRCLLAIIAVLTGLAVPVAAQESGGFLETSLEDALSGDGRVVQIEGFRGALSSDAALDEMTVSDTEGVWLTLRDVELSWTRSALLRGRIEVERLVAAEIVVERAPVPSGGAPSAAASGFQLPELPVAVNIGTISAERLELGEALIGVAAELRIEGGLQLEAGAGEGSFVAERIDGVAGSFDISGSFDNSTRVLMLNGLIDEDPQGLVATLARIHRAPSLRLEITGEGPLSEFAATLALATEGQERLAGQLLISPNGDGLGRAFRADVSGNIAPLFAPAYRDFFGPEIGLVVSGTQKAEGGVRLSEIDLRAAQVALQGELETSADGLPQIIDLTGRIEAADGSPVLLPIAGGETRVQLANLRLRFDAANRDQWTGAIVVQELARAGLSAEDIRLTGTGDIERNGAQRVRADLEFAATELDLSDPEAEQALGGEVSGEAEIIWTSDAPFEFRRIEVNGETYALAGNATVTTTDGGFAIEVAAQAEAEDLAAFSGVAGRDLAGRITVDAEGRVEPISGLVDGTVRATGSGLNVGIDEVDRLLSGGFAVEISGRRDETGSYVDRLTAESDAAQIEANGQLLIETGRVEAEMTLIDTGLIAPDVPGPVNLDVSADGVGPVWDVQGAARGPGLRLDLDTELTLDGEASDIAGVIDAEIRDIAPYSVRIGQPVAGGVAGRAEGRLLADLSFFDLAVRATTDDLTVGQAQADALLTGRVDADATVSRAQGAYRVSGLTASGDFGRLTGQGVLADDLSVGADMALILENPGALLPGLPGPVEAMAEVMGGPGRYDVTAAISGPGTTGEVDFEVDLRGSSPQVAGRISVSAADLAPFSDIARRQLAGGLNAEAEGSVTLDLSAFDVEANAEIQDVRIGQPDMDALFQGSNDVVLDAQRNDDVIRIETFSFEGPQVTANATGSVGAAANEIEFDARLASIEQYLPGFSGALSIEGRADQAGTGDWDVAVSGGGPGGIRAEVSGAVAQSFDRVDLNVVGNLPLAGVNRFIEPRALAGTANFELRVAGPPALESVSGQISASDARFVAPVLGVSLVGLGIDVGLSGARAQVAVDGTLTSGGRVSVTGPVTLSGGFPADLSIAVQNAVLTDPALYRTTTNGTLSVAGGLVGGARISGAVALSGTEVQIPSSGLGGISPIPDLIHLNEPSEVRATRRRAGLIETETAAGGGRPVGLDVTVNSPNQIFLRGRGLEAELGGSIQLGGTTADIVPSGRFELIRGRLDILGKRLVLSEGFATLQGDFDPFLRLVAETSVEDTLIRIVVQGLASQPEILFLSEPELPEDEVLARLLFGRGIETLSPLQAAQLASAVATLAGAGGEGIVSRLRQNFGLDDLDVTGDGSGGVGVRAGKYISDNVYTDLAVDSQGEAEVSINLDVSRSVTVKGSVDSEGQSSIGVFFERDY